MNLPFILRVALAVPIRGLFDYLPGETHKYSDYVIGGRLRVPFGHGQRTAVLVAILNETEIDSSLLKPVLDIIDQKPLLEADHMAFLQWVAAYYHHPFGDVCLSALPVWLRRGKPLLEYRQAVWQVTGQGHALDRATLARAPRQRQLLSALCDAKDAVDRQWLGAFMPGFEAPLKALVNKGLVEKTWQDEALPVHAESGQEFVLNDEQQQAARSVKESEGFAVHLLLGITGSGKTEVYLDIARNKLQQGRQVLALVPEIALTPQLLARFQKRLAGVIVMLHSAMTERERMLAWQQVSSGRADVLIGTRSAVFTPMPRLGLIIVDEEHDASFKQQEGFRYSARDVAVVLGRQACCSVILGSATPSLESLQNALRGNYQLLRLTRRAADAVQPAIDLVDIRSVRLNGGLSPVSRRLIEETLQRDEQVMVFLNRRGFAPVLTCHDCGWVAQCHRCDARMTVHAGSRRLWCHHCGHQQPLPTTCPDCRHQQLVTLGQGTEQLESTLQHLFPDSPCVRIDQDSTRKKGSMQAKFAAISRGEYRLLTGTQMLAKGHHFPGVTLVVVLDCDQGFYGSDFRAAERMAQLLVQVAGRSGRAEKPGRVLIQTRHPDHPMLQLLIHQGYEAFARQALTEREQAGFPPFAYQALVRAEASAPQWPEKFLQSARAAQVTPDPPDPAIEFWGPVPAVMQRKKGRHRFHLLLHSTSRVALQRFLERWIPRLEQLPDTRKVRWSVDIDPQDFYT